jgi:hypothetical protein
MPVVALTYEWRLGLKGVLSFFALAQLSECNREYNRGLPTNHADLLIWIDVLFIDQLSSDVAALLVQSQRVYELARFHVALATLMLLSRAWSPSQPPSACFPPTPLAWWKQALST